MDNILSIIKTAAPVHTTETGEKVVYGRELHKGLEINQDYENWFKEMTDWTNFEEGKDFSTLLSKSSDGLLERDHVLSLRVTKHIISIQDTNIGYEMRERLFDIQERLSEQRSQVAEPKSYTVEDLLEEVKRWIEERKHQALEGRKEE